MMVQHAWGSLVVWYLFLAGTGAGIYLTAIGNKIFRKETSLEKIGYFWGPVLVIGGTGCLLLDLGHPFWAFLAVLRPLSSMISVGTLILTFFILTGMVQLFRILCQKQAIPRFLDMAGFLLACGTATYTGLLLGVVMAIPFWHNPFLLPILFLASALSSGIGFILLLLFLKRKLGCRETDQTIQMIITLDKGLILIELGILAIFLVTSYQAGGAAAYSVTILTNGFFALPFWGFAIGIGLILPLVIEYLNRSHKESLLFICSLALLIGGLMLRYSIVTAGVYIPYI